MIGTWQDAKGNSYTFDESGIESDVAKLETGDYSGPDENGILPSRDSLEKPNRCCLSYHSSRKEFASRGDCQWDRSD